MASPSASKNGTELQKKRKRWYHGMISDSEAEILCKNVEKGAKNNKNFVDGSFMLYNNSDEYDAPYKLLVYYKGEILQFKISSFNGQFLLGEDSGDTVPRYNNVLELIRKYRAGRGQNKLMSPSSCRHPEEHFQLAKDRYIRVAKDKDVSDDLIKKECEINNDPNQACKRDNIAILSGKKWYHGGISNNTADARLDKAASGNNGSYLVYDNPNKKRNAPFLLLIYFREGHIRLTISEINGKYFLGDEVGEKYQTVRELIKYHRGIRGQPIKLSGGQLVTLSKSYVQQNSTLGESMTQSK